MEKATTGISTYAKCVTGAVGEFSLNMMKNLVSGNWSIQGHVVLASTMFYSIEKLTEVDVGLDTATAAGTQDHYVLDQEGLANVLALGTSIHPAPDGIPEWPCIINLAEDQLAGRRMPALMKSDDGRWSLKGKASGIQRNLLLRDSYMKVKNLPGMERFTSARF